MTNFFFWKVTTEEKSEDHCSKMSIKNIQYADLRLAKELYLKNVD